jgi:inner membrane protein
MTLGALAPLARRWPFWVATALLPVLPDLDVLGRPLGVPFHSMWGHRGISHSLVGALVLGAIAALLTRRAVGVPLVPLTLYFAAITATHGVLDALTSGGQGIAFFAPFDATRYDLPWRPIPVSPLAEHFFTDWGWRVFLAELKLVWLPASVAVLVAVALRRGRSQ